MTKKNPEVTIREAADGRLYAVYRTHWYRFLLSDGRTLDIISDRDGGELRSALVEWVADSRISIVGVAELAPEEDES